jgi:GTP diphosphokinase / guanosine-3',5'-bis(diphosphate) 3'-diphosphatase
MMLDRIKELISKYSTVSSFELLVRKHFSKDRNGCVLVMRALRTAMREHRGKTRLDGNPVLGHPLAVAVLLMVRHQIREAEVIAAALLHLFIEDVDGWDFHRLHDAFGFKVAMNIWFVSKEPSKEVDDEEEGWVRRTELSHDKLLHAPPGVQKLKLCDRFNNLLSIKSLPKWKQKRMLRDTVDYYVPLSRTLEAFEEELLEAVKCASRAD